MATEVLDRITLDINVKEALALVIAMSIAAPTAPDDAREVLQGIVEQIREQAGPLAAAEEAEAARGAEVDPED